MKSIIKISMLSAAILTILAACSVQRKSSTNNASSRLVLTDTTQTTDSLEYDLVIFDPGFEYWLSSHSFSRNQYSNQYLSSMNHMYVTEWNRRYSIGDHRIESYIDYSPFIEYDFELNYKLFMYFKYFEDTYNTKLLPTERR